MPILEYHHLTREEDAGYIDVKKLTHFPNQSPNRAFMKSLPFPKLFFTSQF